MGKSSNIKIEVKLDDHNVPEQVLWMAEDSGQNSPTEAKGLLISIFEKVV